MPAKIDVVGGKFGRLTVLRDMPHIPGRRRRVECLCDCGAGAICEPRDLISGDTKSCGCYHREAVAASSIAIHTTHGRSKTGIYNIWIKMRGRCGNPLDKKYPIYGGRGITVCERWDKSFENFLSDMGERPSRAHSIDRIDVNGHYEPGNCRWALPIEQSRNKRVHRLVAYNGKPTPLSEACENAGVNYRSALYRLNHGLPWAPPSGPRP